MILGTQVGLGPGHIVLDKDSAPLRRRGLPVLIIVMILSWRQTSRQPPRIKADGDTVGIEQEDPSAMDGRTL